MKRIRWQIISLATWLTLLFNIERLGDARRPPLGLTTLVYPLVALTLGVFLFVPMRRPWMLAALATLVAAYLALKALSGHALLGGADTYLTLVELGALLISGRMAWALAQTIGDFEHAVEAIVWPEDRPRLLSYDQARQRLRSEIGRARRHQRPLSVAVIDLDPSSLDAALHRSVREVQAAMVERYVQVRFGIFLSRHIRETDALARFDEQGRFVLLAPDVSSERTAQMLARLAQAVEGQLGVRFRYSIADFPDTALTSDELLRRASEALGSPQQQAIADEYRAMSSTYRVESTEP